MILKKVFLFIFGSLVAFIGVEIGFRVNFKAIPAAVKPYLGERLVQRYASHDVLLANNDYLGYHLKPNFTKTFRLHLENSSQVDAFTVQTTSFPRWPYIGFRDQADTAHRPFAVAVGDSYVMGYGVEQSQGWVDVLSKRLGQKVFNMGCLRYSVVQSARMLEHYGLPLQPKMVLFGFTRNDFSDTTKFFQLQEGIRQRTLKRAAGLRSFLWDNSITYAFLKAFPAVLKKAFVPKRMIQSDGQILMNVSYLDENAGYDLVGMEPSFAALKEVHKACQRAGIRLIVIIFPDPFNFFWDRSVAHIQDPQRVEHLMNIPYEHIKAFCRRERIEFIDANVAFIPHRNEHLFFKLDTHLNREGNALLAKMVHTYLTKSGGVSTAALFEK